jgi:hypothetical protein
LGIRIEDARFRVKVEDGVRTGFRLRFGTGF